MQRETMRASSFTSAIVIALLALATSSLVLLQTGGDEISKFKRSGLSASNPTIRP